MSHVVTHSIAFDSLEALERACKTLGWTFCKGQPSYAWYGRWMDDSPIPAHLFAPEEAERIRNLSCEERRELLNSILGRCEHAIRIPGCSYEIGFMRDWQGKLVAIWDWYSSGGLHHVLGTPTTPERNPLFQAYSIERIKLFAERNGVEVSAGTLHPSGVWECDIVEKPQVFAKGVFG